MLHGQKGSPCMHSLEQNSAGGEILINAQQPQRLLAICGGGHCLTSACAKQEDTHMRPVRLLMHSPRMHQPCRWQAPHP